eukprot:comp24069_c1_seq1/m.43273 comp24069_c1_seq1/g.43273  ORF comp24069_c1_seq1/g.43273 comp24069_c1_seq1/m.43273 type:complete len:338 (-) comp24069_c1_seq1:330-1343(-)
MLPQWWDNNMRHPRPSGRGHRTTPTRCTTTPTVWPGRRARPAASGVPGTSSSSMAPQPSPKPPQGRPRSTCRWCCHPPRPIPSLATTTASQCSSTRVPLQVSGHTSNTSRPMRPNHRNPSPTALPTRHSTRGRTGPGQPPHQWKWAMHRDTCSSSPPCSMQPRATMPAVCAPTASTHHPPSTCTTHPPSRAHHPRAIRAITRSAHAVAVPSGSTDTPNTTSHHHPTRATTMHGANRASSGSSSPPRCRSPASRTYEHHLRSLVLLVGEGCAYRHTSMRLNVGVCKHKKSKLGVDRYLETCMYEQIYVLGWGQSVPMVHARTDTRLLPALYFKTPHGS